MVVRRYVGYLRYEGAEQVDWLNGLYATLRLYTNFFSRCKKPWRKNVGESAPIAAMIARKRPFNA